MIMLSYWELSVIRIVTYHVPNILIIDEQSKQIDVIDIAIPNDA